MNKIIVQLKVMSLLVMLLGIIHTAATFAFFPVFKKDALINYTSLYMFVMVGISVVFTGCLQWVLSDKFIDSKPMRRIMNMSIWFMIIIGAGAVFALPDNPFAYVSLAIAIYEIVLMAFSSQTSNSVSL
jgi:hypothetical protein